MYKNYKSSTKSKPKIIYQKIVFDSLTELNYYKYLQNKQKQKQLVFIYHPIPLNLVKNKTCKLTKKHLVANYYPDFIVIWTRSKKIEIIDTKGSFLSQAWKIKRKWILTTLNNNDYYVSYILDVLKNDFKSKISLKSQAIINNVSFKELCLDQSGSNFIEVEAFIAQKRQIKKDSRAEVKMLVKQFELVVKQSVKNWKNTDFDSLEFDLLILYFKKLKSSKPWNAYLKYKNNKRYRKKRQEIRDLKTLLTKSLNLKTKKARTKYKLILVKKLIIISKLKIKIKNINSSP